MSPRTSLSVLLCVCAALSSCATVAATGPKPVITPPAVAPAPRLVVAVVLDQFGSDELLALEPLFDQGALAHARAHGRVLEQVVYGYAATLTAPGHAAIFSGALPRDSGVVSNHVVDRTTGKRRAVVDDGEHAVLGVDGVFAGPAVLRVDTVGDALKTATGTRGKTVALSLKDRSAILAAGKHPDLVLFYERTVGFTTSSYYASALPAWLVEYEQAHPIDATAVSWELPDPERFERLLGPDDGPGEGDFKGLGKTFPHRLAGNADASELWSYTPASTEYLFDLAFEAATQLQLGTDETPDLLIISVSGTDYTGHVFGPASWEYADHVRRADRALLRLVQRLSERTSVSVLVTSDHGVAPLPERAIATVPSALRIDSNAASLAVEAALDTALGAGDWVAGYIEPYLYLTPQARARSDAATVRATAIHALLAQPGIFAAFDAVDTTLLAQKAQAGDEVAQRVLAGIDPERGGDVYAVPQMNAIPDAAKTVGAGTTHGSPWPYDTHVPVFMWGPNVTPGRNHEPLNQGRVAATLAALLGIAPPAAATLPPLPGATVHKATVW